MRNQSGNQGSSGGGQFQRHSQANIGDVAFHIESRGCRGGGNHRDQADADGRVHGQSIVDGQQRGNDDAAADSGQGAEASGKEAYCNQQEGNAKAHRALSLRDKARGSSSASARRATPTEPSTTNVAIIMVRDTVSLPIKAPSKTATAGTSRLTVE